MIVLCWPTSETTKCKVVSVISDRVGEPRVTSRQSFAVHSKGDGMLPRVTQPQQRSFQKQPRHRCRRKCEQERCREEWQAYL